MRYPLEFYYKRSPFQPSEQATEGKPKGIGSMSGRK
jgi:hypothetical protein